ncbi:glycosyltransferase family 2 protein [bacterium]|nr:glycosyltransferase family 2 protein [bacterium]
MWRSYHGSGVTFNAGSGITARAVSRVGWTLESLTWKFRASSYRRLLAEREPIGLTIGITTYKDRFDSCLRPLIAKLSLLFPKEQIIVIANGHYLTDEQHKYIRKFEAFCARFSNVEPESYTDPRGLSFLWNRIIARSSSDNILILNDDIMVKAGFRSFVEESGLARASMATINASWSHFKISRDIIDRVGLFDEGFTEIGGEDDDYIARMAMHGLSPGNYSTGSLKKSSPGRVRPGAVNSYGKIMAEQLGGYSTVNSGYLRSKWNTSDEHFEGSFEVKGRMFRYWKLK